MRNRINKIVLLDQLLLALCLLAPNTLLAQNAAIKGTVTDPSGAVVVGANIAAHSAQGNLPIARSGAGGTYALIALKPGKYSLEVSAPGFKAVTLPAEVAEGATITVDVKLALAAVATEVRVIDTTAPSGSYNVPVTSFGPLGEVEVLNTPYTLNTIPTNLMENQQARTFSDALKYMPYAQMEARGQLDVGRPQTRGFEGAVIQNSRLDGLNVIDTTSYPMEMLDRIEVQSGLAGMYGAQTPAGMFNFVLKRPTTRPVATVDASVDSPTQTMLHGDFAGPLTRFLGYRVNLLHANGTSYVDFSHRRRELVAASIDVTPFKHTRLELNGSNYADHFHGFPGMWGYTTFLPAPLDPKVAGYGQSWAGTDLTTRTVSARLLQGIGSNWSLTAGGIHQSANRILYTPNNTITGVNAFTMKVNLQGNTFYSDSNMAHLNGHVMTGKVAHDVVLGTNGYVWRNNSLGVWSGSTLTSPALLGAAGKASTFTSPGIFAAPTMPALTGSYKNFTDWAQSFVFADSVTISRHWMANFIGSANLFGNLNFNTDGTLNTTTAPKDNQFGFTPSASLLYKPTASQTAYFTYATSMYQGDVGSYTVGTTTTYYNLAPYHSKQYEAGYKVRFKDAELTAAAFRMNRPWAYLSNGVYAVAGNQLNQGLDFMAKGKLPYGFNVYGGFTWIDPKLDGTVAAATTGKQVIGVPRIQANFLIEDKIAAVKGLALQINWHHAGVRAGNVTNTIWVPKYDTVDLGARYEQRINAGQLTWRIAASNVGDAHYWSSIFPNNINGTTSTGTSAFLGTPRVVSASVQFRFNRE